MRYADGRLEEVSISAIVPGDRLLIRTGEVLPVDGSVSGGDAVLDQAALTGEPLAGYSSQSAALITHTPCIILMETTNEPL
jgi:P-type E1-E2 ATPase